MLTPTDTTPLNMAVQLFRAPFLKKVATGTHHEYLEEILEELKISSRCSKGNPKILRQVIAEVYYLLVTKYQCEYVFKNVVAKNLYLKRHSPLNTHFASEMRIGQSRADVTIFNGTSTVYEIKSEYDSFEKLEGQIADYQTVFDIIFLVVPVSLHAKALRTIKDDIGLIVVSENLNLRTVRLAQSNKRNTSPSAIFDVMRRREYEECIRSRLGACPDVPNTDSYSACKSIFSRWDSETAHDLMVKQLRYRSAAIKIDRVIEFPELLFTFLTADFTRTFSDKLAIALNSSLCID